MKAFTAPRGRSAYQQVKATDSHRHHHHHHHHHHQQQRHREEGQGEEEEEEGKENEEATSTVVELQTPHAAAQSTTPLPSSSQPPPVESDESLQASSLLGLQWSLTREVSYYALALLTAGLSSLLCFWFPRVGLTLRYRPSSLSTAHFVLVLTPNRQQELCPVERCQPHPPSQRPVLLTRYLRPPPPLDPAEKMIVFRHSRYLYDPPSQSFLRLSAPSTLPYASLASALSHGTSSSAAAASYALHGPNAIDIPIPSIPSLLVREVLHPFFVFQIYSIILWCAEAYYYFAGCIAIIAAVSIVTTLLETRRRLFALSEVARFTSQVRVNRGGQWVAMDSSALIPGDVVQLTTGSVPCDLALLSGAAVVNESMLTGESLPILKSPVDIANKAADAPISLSSSSHTLFSATSILQLKPDPAGAGHVVGLVTRTGWFTTKGSLILSILYPAPSSFRFVEQSYRFVGLLFLVSLVGFVISIYQLQRVGASAGLIVLRGMDLITIVVPPSLPLALSVGTNYALLALRRRKVHCISPAKINVAGKVRLMAFDKTGTLTSEGMEMKGVRPVADGRFTDFVTLGRAAAQAKDQGRGGTDEGEQLCKGKQRLALVDSETEDVEAMAASVPAPASAAPGVSPALLAALSCCHSLAVLDGELIGDPLEEQIFRSTGASIEESPSSSSSSSSTPSTLPSPSSTSTSTSSTCIHLPSSLSSPSPPSFRYLHIYEFQSSLQRMSVVCHSSDGSHFVFTKGAPEVVQSLCLASTVPSSFTSDFAAYARQGYRVLAIAYKRIGQEALQADREVVRPLLERELSLLGLVVLENAVKVETAPTLAVLREARVRCVMVTGDYSVTALSVAKECGLIAHGVRVYQGSMQGEEGGVEWRDSEDDVRQLDPLTLRPIDLPPHPYELAITGDVFRHLLSSTPPSAFHRVLLSTAIFARMSPDQKAVVITSLQSLSLYTGMCGDGANDAPALRAAHVGVSLSSSEASIAAPFTYLEPNIRCVPLLLSQGRSALQTSFSLFRFIAMYSLIQFGAAILCYFVGSVLGNWQYLYQDMWVVFILTLLMGGVEAVDEVSVKRPSGDLLSFANLLSILSHAALCIAFQVAVFVTTQHQPGYIAYQDAPGFDHRAETMETTSLYYFSNFQYLLYALLFARGRPWKRPVYTNLRFTFWCLVVAATNLALLFSAPTVGFWRSEDVDLPMAWRGGIFGYVLAQWWVSAVWELWMLPCVTRGWKRWRMRKAGGEVGEVYGQVKRITGSGVKEYHRLRGAFEQGWKSARHLIDV